VRHRLTALAVVATVLIATSARSGWAALAAVAGAVAVYAAGYAVGQRVTERENSRTGGGT